MAINYTVNYSGFDSDETSKTTSVSEQLCLKLIRTANMLSKLAFPGQLLFIDTSRSGVQNPSTSVWIGCSGLEITSTDSPFVNSTSPNLLNKYFRMGSSTTANASVGSASLTGLSHSHTIGSASIASGIILGVPGNRNSYFPDTIHFHGTGSGNRTTAVDQTSPVSLDRNHFNVAAYIKIT